MTLWQEGESDSRVWRVLAWTALLAYCLFSGMKYSENIHLVQALGGWSPMDWVAQQTLPENFKADFQSGISAYRMSSMMHLYLVLSGFGIDLETLVPWVIRFEVAFLGLGAAVLFRAVVPKAPYLAMVIFAVLVVEGSARGMDLARFNTLYQGLFYNLADGFRLLGLAALFSRRLVLAAVLLGIAVTVHPVKAGMAALFIAPYAFLVRGQHSLRQWLLAGGSFLLIAGVWLITRIQSVEVTSGGIPADEWMSLVRMFTFHWFPVDIGVFTRMHERYILPLLCLVGLAMLYLPRVVRGHAERLGIVLGMALLAVLSFAGVLISELSSEPFLVKLALHRASEMLILVSLLIAVAGLTREVLGGRFLEGALGVGLILSPLSNASSFPVVATVALAGLHALRGRRTGDTTRFWLAAGVGLSLLVSVFIYFFMGIPKLKEYFGGAIPWAVALVFAVARVVHGKWMSIRVSQHAVLTSVFGLALLSAFLGLAVINTDRKSAMSEETKQVAADYLAVQRWASASTPRDALFMVDPTLRGYGWRDFSQRSAFGHLREWLHTSWLYDSQLDRYLEGRKRFGEFGIDIDSYRQIRPSINGYHQLRADVRRALYNKEEGWFNDIAQRYGVDYVVLQKKLITRELRFRKVFENTRFVAFKLSK